MAKKRVRMPRHRAMRLAEFAAAVSGRPRDVQEQGVPIVIATTSIVRRWQRSGRHGGSLQQAHDA